MNPDYERGVDLDDFATDTRPADRLGDIKAGAPIHRGKYCIDHQGNPHKFYNPDDVHDHTYNGDDE